MKLSLFEQCGLRWPSGLLVIGLELPRDQISALLAFYSERVKSHAPDQDLNFDLCATGNPVYCAFDALDHVTTGATNLEGGLRSADTAIEDIFIRKFMTGTWHSLFVSEVIIKRQHNMIRIAGIIRQAISPRKMYFLLGYCEELLSYWLQCPVKLELQTVADKKDVVFKYI
uniref:Ribosomal protein S24 n=1 Tax=Timema cristinae TaxID=61476 RepID=A0A7R9D4K0_TIMCR|nr:unnamed protein product [Timema cristinae]